MTMLADAALGRAGAKIRRLVGAPDRFSFGRKETSRKAPERCI
jgi:hypothetical protein